MKALLLAAGAGTRLLPFTEDKCKTMVQVAGESLIDRIITILKESNITDIIIVTGHFSTKLQQHIEARFPDVTFTFVFNPEYFTKNNIVSLYLGLKTVSPKDDILLIETDLIFDHTVLEKILKCDSKNISVLAKYENWMDGAVVTLKDHLVTALYPKKVQSADFKYTRHYKTVNIYKLSGGLCEKTLIPHLERCIAADPQQYYEDAFVSLIAKRKLLLYGLVLKNEKWYEIDDPIDLKVASYIFDSEKSYNEMSGAFGGYWLYGFKDFSLLTNPYFPNDSILRSLKDELELIIKNYSSCQKILNEKLSYFVGVPKDNLIFLNGLSQIYPLLAQIFKGKKVLLPMPTFGEYLRVFTDILEYKDNFSFDGTAFSRISENADVIVFVNPNNPTGTLIDPCFIHNFAKQNTEKTIIVDESYIDFSGECSLLQESARAPLDNLVILKSLSKNLGVPGLRIGFIYTTNKDILSFVNSALPVWGVNSIAERYVELLIKNKGALNESITKTITARDLFIQQLRALSNLTKVYDTSTNFVVIKICAAVVDKCHLLKNLLVKWKILVKDLSPRYKDGEIYLRVAVRTEEDNSYFVRCLKEELDNE